MTAREVIDAVKAMTPAERHEVLSALPRPSPPATGSMSCGPCDCPKCGGPALRSTYREHAFADETAWVRCEKCGVIDASAR